MAQFKVWAPNAQTVELPFGETDRILKPYKSLILET